VKSSGVDSDPVFVKDYQGD